MADLYELTINKVEEGYTVSLLNKETGEIREVTRKTVESAMRTLGRTVDSWGG